MYIRKSEYSDTLHYTVGSVSSDGCRNGRDSSLKRLNDAMVGHCHHNTRGCLNNTNKHSFHMRVPLTAKRQSCIEYDLMSTDPSELLNHPHIMLHALTQPHTNAQFKITHVNIKGRLTVLPFSKTKNILFWCHLKSVTNNWAAKRKHAS